MAYKVTCIGPRKNMSGGSTESELTPENRCVFSNSVVRLRYFNVANQNLMYFDCIE